MLVGWPKVARPTLLFVLLSGLSLGIFSLWRAYDMLQIGLAFTAKNLCSAVFVSRRPVTQVLEQDLGSGDLAMLRWLDNRIEWQRGRVTTRLPNVPFGPERAALYRSGQGCVLELPASLNSENPATTDPGVNPVEFVVPPTIKVINARLRKVVEQAFQETSGGSVRGTRAVVVLHEGKVVAEAYGAGFNAATPMPGWSLAKTVINALIGIMVAEQRLTLQQINLAPEWRNPGDARTFISVENLLRMTSGLGFTETHDSLLQNITFMLFREPDAAAYAASQPLQYKVGTHWSYSSGSSILLSRLIRQVLGDAKYRDFPRRALFEPLDMDSVVLEKDPGGTYLASSFMYATARDWARLGQLYVNDGNYAGRQILPKGWVRNSITPNPDDVSNGQYGSHFWLKLDDEHNESDLPGDTFHARGFEGQYITMIPSRNLVVVRLGLTRTEGAWNQTEFMQSKLKAMTN